ncbi:hypothetical protein IWQ61_004266 [Dispira simplex]|nr:hypothetical protein IWQ61_004266 [Dispira simplex]
MTVIGSFVSAGTPLKISDHGSRKGKKAWRKNIDVNDVQEALHDLRAEEELGGGKLETRENEKLFTIDTDGDVRVQKKLKGVKHLQVSQVQALRVKAQQEGSTGKYVRSDTLSEQVNKKSRKTLGTLSTEAAINRMARQMTQGKPVSARALRAHGQLKAKSKRQVYSMWGTPDTPTPAQEAPLVKVPQGVELEFIKETLPKAIRMPSSIGKGYDVPALLPAHPGASYQPRESDHTALVEEISKRRKSKSTARNKLKRRMAPNIRSVRNYRPVTMEEDIQAMVQEQSDVSDHSESEAEEEEEKSVDPSAPDTVQTSADPPRKTKRQRRKESKLRAARIRALLKIRRKQFRAMFQHLPQMATAADEQARQRSDKEQRTQMLALKRATLPRKKMGRHPVRPLPLVADKAKSKPLRHVHSKTNLFMERLRSMEWRNIIEPRGIHSRRPRPHIAWREKTSFKMFK